MEKETLRVGKECDEMKAKAEKAGGLCLCLWKRAESSYNQEAYRRLWEQLCQIYGKSPEQLGTVEEFWRPALKKAVIHLVGEARQADMEEMSRIQMEGQFSSSMYRRSYRSRDFGYHAADMVSKICNWIYWTAYGKSVIEMMYYDHSWVRGYDMYLALALRRGEPQVVELVREAMLGENQEILLSHTMIRAVILSGHEELLELLLKLLLAARLQEGLRQQILEQADAGSMETLCKILKLCVEEDMFRYSSAIRALGTWAGLGFDNEKSAVVKKYAALAYQCLTDEKARAEYLDSPNNLEAYFAIWAMASHETGECDQYVQKLLSDDRKYRRTLGWYFVRHSDSPGFQMYLAKNHLAERDEELLAWVVSNLAVTHQAVVSYRWSKELTEPMANDDLPSSRSGRKELFQELQAVAEFIGGKNREFTGSPFPYSSVILENERVIGCMMSLVFYDLDEEMTLELAPLRTWMSVEQRCAYYRNYLKPQKNVSHRKILREALNDRSIQVKELAVEALSACKLLSEDMEVLTESLRSKSSSLRKSVLAILKKQPAEKLSPVIGNMLASSLEYQRQAGIELLLELKEQEPELLEEQQAALKALAEKKISSQTEILLKQLQTADTGESGAEDWTVENGFGLYDLEYMQAQQEPQTEQAASSLYTEKELKERYALPRAEVDSFLERMNAVFERHADYEYETIRYDGSRNKVLFGFLETHSVPIPAEYGTPQTLQDKEELRMIPFYEEFLEASGEFATDVEKYIALYYLTTSWNGLRSFGGSQEYEEWYLALIKKELSPFYSAYDKYKDRDWQIRYIMKLMAGHFDSHDLFEAVLPVYRSMVQVIGLEKLGISYTRHKEGTAYYYGNVENYPINMRMIGVWRPLLAQAAVSAEDFKRWFLTEHDLEKTAGVSTFSGLTIEDYFRACDMGIMQKDVLYWRFLQGKTSDSDIRMLTNPVRWVRGRKILEAYDWARGLVDKTVNRIVEVEEKRGELVTPLTNVARAIERFEGAEHFARLLAALGKEKFFRGYDYSSDTTKRAVLSRLLKRCCPMKSDTAAVLKEALKKTDIKENRLAETVMYAPQWAGFAEEILGWKGLKCGVWFFQAHINESFSAEKETEAALYSPITPQQFNDGAFDKDWFFQAYESLGEKRFQVLYKSAKYITSGSNQHRRSQLYADAVSGRLDAAELQAEIREKRNQEKLRCYPLIPMGENHREEVLERYEFIQQFLKESKQFGAQRRESERKACNTALENLAVTAGFSDVNRMTWYLESEKINEIRPLMEPVELSGVRVWLEIDEDGMAELAVEKHGKRQKTLPKTIQKHETILTLKETIKELKEQRHRGRESLERAMVEGTEFGMEELTKISGNPVLSPMLFSLVWVLQKGGDAETGGQATENSPRVCGFLEKTDQGLVLRELQSREQVSDEPENDRPAEWEHFLREPAAGGALILRLAHPHDLMEAKVWSLYMHNLYQEKMVQPFKQVFREYYPMTEDERQEKNISRRYAGYQVQPQKTAALLKGRGWTVDYEEGLQKVCYKENIIVRMYALAAWFSPADIEAPTLEVVRFYDRNTGELVDLDKIPPILFSEAMRDIDLAVSVAHVGGVDPEASHSTVEMRSAIAKELAGLLRLSNVTFVGSHAKINGKLGDYSIHMGSGVVHAQAVGMLAILPVHSQARGRIFLPFADDDPKTAEIMSKIILLAEDTKIKDTSILSQIQG